MGKLSWNSLWEPRRLLSNIDNRRTIQVMMLIFKVWFLANFCGEMGVATTCALIILKISMVLLRIPTAVQRMAGIEGFKWSGVTKPDQKVGSLGQPLSRNHVLKFWGVSPPLSLIERGLSYASFMYLWNYLVELSDSFNNVTEFHSVMDIHILTIQVRNFFKVYYMFIRLILF